MNSPRGTSAFLSASDTRDAQRLDEIDLTRITSTLWRGKWVILCLALIVSGIGYAYASYIAVPLFRATAVVILNTRQDQIVDLQSVATGLTGDYTEINSELEVLRARGLIGKVVDQLGLTSDPEFNATLRPPSIPQKAQSWIGSIIPFAPIPPVRLRPDPDTNQTREAVISALLDQLTVRNIRSSLVFNITVTSQDPAKAARLADTIVETYILNQIAVKFEATEQATLWLTDRVAELRQRLEQAELDVSLFTAQTELVSEAALRAQERQVKELRERIALANSDRAALFETVANLESADTRAERAEIMGDPQLLRNLPNDKASSTRLASYDAQLQRAEDGLREDLARSNRQIAILRGSETELQNQITRQGEDLIQLQHLTREAEATRLLYEYFLTRLNETAAQQGIQQADSRILSQAVIPARPSEPRKTQIVLLSAVLGILLGLAFILWREMRNKSFRNARELERFSGHTVIGQIPTIPARKRSGVLAYLQHKPNSAASEAIRDMRTSLMLTHADQMPKVIVSTSTVPDEGKTTVSLALAHHLVGLGKKVLLIEGDIRRHILHDYFPDMPDRGLVSVLSGEQRLQAAIYRSPSFGADLLGGEDSGVNAADLFASQRFRALIDHMRETYDTIIIDTPPVLVVPDARIIAQVSDAILFTVQWDKTSKTQLEEALRLFRHSGQTISGLVLSRINPRGMRKYGYADLGGAYAHFGNRYYAR